MTYCGQRAPYYKQHSGLCMLEPHGPDVEHVVEMVSVDVRKVDYGTISRYRQIETEVREECRGEQRQPVPAPEEGG